MHRCVTQLYYRLFYYLEHSGLLNPLSEVHLSALHFNFLKRINRSLNVFQEGWNHHRVRTEGLSPHQLFTQGVIQTQMSLNFDEVDDDFGVDDDNPIPDDYEAVDVPDIRVDLSAAALTRLHQIDPLQQCSDYGVSLYLEAVDIIAQDMQSNSSA